MNRIGHLSEIFSKYEIYPRSLFTDKTPKKEFQQLCPENYYSREAEELIEKQDYGPTRRGADLPWRGRKFS